MSVLENFKKELDRSMFSMDLSSYFSVKFIKVLFDDEKPVKEYDCISEKEAINIYFMEMQLNDFCDLITGADNADDLSIYLIDFITDKNKDTNNFAEWFLEKYHWV